MINESKNIVLEWTLLRYKIICITVSVVYVAMIIFLSLIFFNNIRILNGDVDKYAQIGYIILIILAYFILIIIFCVGIYYYRYIVQTRKNEINNTSVQQERTYDTPNVFIHKSNCTPPVNEIPNHYYYPNTYF